MSYALGVIQNTAKIAKLLKSAAHFLIILCTAKLLVKCKINLNQVSNVPSWPHVPNLVGVIRQAQKKR